MQKLRKRLPPPNLLVTFEAAGRHRSFTRAAVELNVTRVAVSQQVKTLETYLGVALFHRLHHSLSLTPAGERYHQGITAALERALQATIEIGRHADSQVVTVTATAGFTTYWLMPNIGEFRARHPGIELRFVISDKYLDLVEENIDIAIRYSDAAFEGVEMIPLVREVISPTCAGTYLPAGQRLEPADLLQHPLIHLDGPYNVQTRWAHWFRVQGMEVNRPRTGLTVNTYTNLVQAALDGQGFALIGPPLINRFLAAGSLVQPVRAPVIDRHAFHLAVPRLVRLSPAAQAFCAWIKESFAAADVHDLDSAGSHRVAVHLA